MNEQLSPRHLDRIARIRARYQALYRFVRELSRTPVKTVWRGLIRVRVNEAGYMLDSRGKPVVFSRPGPHESPVVRGHPVNLWKPENLEEYRVSYGGVMTMRDDMVCDCGYTLTALENSKVWCCDNCGRVYEPERPAWWTPREGGQSYREWLQEREQLARA